MEEIELQYETIKVESKVRKLETPKYILPYPILWRVEKLIRKIINKPPVMIPLKITIGEPIIAISKSCESELTQELIKEIERGNNSVQSPLSGSDIEAFPLNSCPRCGSKEIYHNKTLKVVKCRDCDLTAHDF